jgi:hypothetical protein
MERNWREINEERRKREADKGYGKEKQLRKRRR